MNKHCIFMGLVEVAGYYTNLKKGFDELGIKSVFVNLDKNPFKYGAGQDEARLVRLVRTSGERRYATPRAQLLPKLWWCFVHTVSYRLLFWWAVFRCDVFIFGFLSTFFNFRELPLLKALGKKVVYVFHGSDSRPHYLNGFGSELLAAAELVKLTRKQKQDIRRVERYADVIVCNPLSAHLHQRPYLAYQLIGVPLATGTLQFSPMPRASAAVRILHAPSQTAGKGTAQVRAAIESLRQKGHLIDYVEMSGKPHTGVLEQLQQCDFVVDQVYSDTPMAHFAAEAAFFGKPAVVGGYGAREFARVFDSQTMPPVHYCLPDELENAIKRLIVDEAYRVELGRRAREYVLNNWSARKVAERFIQAIEGKVDSRWEYYPQDIRYVHGCGLSEHRAKQLVRTLLAHGGKEALQLSDKPELEQRFVDFASYQTKTARLRAMQASALAPDENDRAG